MQQAAGIVTAHERRQTLNILCSALLRLCVESLRLPPRMHLGVAAEKQKEKAKKKAQGEGMGEDDDDET